MCKVLRLALPVFLTGVFALGVGTTPVSAVCDSGIPIFLGYDGFPVNADPASCGLSPSAAFWLVGYGDPALEAGVDSGNSYIQYDIMEGWGGLVSADWGNTEVDGCPLEYLQPDGTFGPMAMILSSEAGGGTPFHTSGYSAFSADFYEPYGQYYSMDIAFGDISLFMGDPLGSVECAPLVKPAVTGPASALVLSWPDVVSYDDCAYSPNIEATDCVGGFRPLLAGWNVYYAAAPCTVGTLTADRTAAGLWTKINSTPLAIGANAGTPPLTAPDPAAGECLFLAYSPVWGSGFEGRYLSSPSDPVGGDVDSDLDGILDNADNCPLVPNEGQEDGDGDLIGDACDNCPADVNYDQADANENGLGDICDYCPTSGDADGDFVCDEVDNCPDVPNEDQSDLDGDTYGDACDVCPMDPLNDSDGDGVCGNEDNCPDVVNAGQEDADSDGMGDACDPCPYEAVVVGQEGIDKDGDDICSCDPVLFNAGVCDGMTGLDNCPRTWNPTQTPSGWGDGLGADCEDNLGVALLTPGGTGGGLGSCYIRFTTVNEWNCPTFRVISRGPKGDRDTGIPPIPCIRCTSGLGVSGVYYGGDTGFYIKQCRGGHGVYVLAERAVTTSTCPTFVNPNTLVGISPELLAVPVE